MRSTFTAKLIVLVTVATLSGAVATVASSLIGAQQNRDLEQVEYRLVPRLELGPRLTTEFAQLARSMQDAVAAEDAAQLSSTADLKARLIERVDGASELLTPEHAAALHDAIEAYYQSAHAVSQRMLAGETGEQLLDEMQSMQNRQKDVEKLIAKHVVLDRSQLVGAFNAVRGANERANQFRLAIGVAGLLLMLGLSVWLTTGLLRSLRHLASGFARFATGEFDQPIPNAATTDLASLTQAANQMAGSLKQLAQAQARDAWLKTARSGLSDKLRGDMTPTEMAQRALRFLATQIHAVAGVLYLRGKAGTLELRARLARSGGQADAGGAVDSEVSHVVPGEGLLGEAALSGEVVVIEQVPADYLKVVSGLGAARPVELVFLSLSRKGRTVGVAEFALFEKISEQHLELLRSVQEMLALAFETSLSRADLEALLVELNEQATRLTAQEEELRLSNGELKAQQEELRVTNEMLETQRRALHESNTQIEKARVHLQQKAEELTRVSSYKSQFLANMSHELRTPLNSMLLLSHLLATNSAGNLTSKQVEHLQIIHSAGEDLLALINQILDLAKIESGRQELNKQEVPLEHFAAFSRRMFSEVARTKSIGLEIEIDQDLPATIVTDIGRLERILVNLIGNAIKFTQAGSVSLRIQRPAAGVTFQNPELGAADVVAFAVKDTGPGIDPKSHDRVFQPFEQVEADSTRRYAGTGLGLAIARESALLLGGELQLRSTLGEGSTFICFLPVGALDQPRAPAPIPIEANRHLELAVPRHGGAEETRLLVIEDDPVLSEQLVAIIKARKLGALTARTAEEGLRLARDASVAGIILDVRLPDMDGWSVMTRLRNDSATRHIPVHFITAIDKPEQGLALGAVGYLVKPVTHSDLTNAVSTLVRPTDGARPHVLLVEDDLHEGRAILEYLASEDVEATHVRNASAALAALKTEQFGCMILDLGLPDGDGLALLEALKADAAREAPRVLVHTGRALTKHEIRQLETYAQAVILKDARSGERLVEEVRCFVKHIKEGAVSKRNGTPLPAPLPAVPDVSLADTILLLAEDDMRTVYALSALMLAKGAEVLVAENGKEALDLLRENPKVNAVLMDIMMPEMDGYEAIRQLRQDPRFAKLPVIALTAKAMKGERERCLEAGATEYLSKPVEADQLLGTLGRLLKREKVVAPSQSS